MDLQVYMVEVTTASLSLSLPPSLSLSLSIADKELRPECWDQLPSSAEAPQHDHDWLPRPGLKQYIHSTGTCTMLFNIIITIALLLCLACLLLLHVQSRGQQLSSDHCKQHTSEHSILLTPTSIINCGV